MSGKITMKPLDGSEQDFATWADQWVDQNCHLPPGGDHSWREREVQRIFGGNAEDPNKDNEYPPPDGWADAQESEGDGSYEPGFRRAWTTRNIILPICLAAFAVLAAGFFTLPEALQSRFWDSRQPDALSAPPVRIVNEAVAEKDGAPRLIREDASEPDKGKALNPVPPPPASRVAAPAKETASPLLRPPIAEKHAVQKRMPGAHVAKAPKKPAVSSPSPIGATYFARRAPTAAAKKQIATTLPPIGQAYFESHSPAAAN